MAKSINKVILVGNVGKDPEVKLLPSGLPVANLGLATSERFKDKTDDFFIKPAAIAEEAWHVVHQDRSAWSFNVEVRPFHEPW